MFPVRDGGNVRTCREALTVWAAPTSDMRQEAIADSFASVRDASSGRARQVLGAEHRRAAEERGAGMSLVTAAEFALMLTVPAPQAAAAAPGSGKRSPRERELVTLVARGRTDADIAEQLYISTRTVRSRLDRIRNKTGCRRRADLTRPQRRPGLARSAGRAPCDRNADHAPRSVGWPSPIKPQQVTAGKGAWVFAT